jgi:A118 family predicted phage portal protein
MNFLTTIREILRRLFGIDPIVTQAEANELEEQAREYRRLDSYNVTAIFAEKMATLTVTESGVEVVGDSQRAQLINDVIRAIWTKKRKWASTAYGTGGVLLIPYVIGGRIYVDTVPQSCMLINRVNGNDLRAVSILADTTLQNENRYFRWTDYSLEDNGLLTIRQRATDETGSEVPLHMLAEWEMIMEEMTITGVEHLLFAYIKCPKDNRKSKDLYGVPITYGCDAKIREIVECQEDIRREYKLKKPIVGMDSTMFEVKNGRRSLPVTGLFMPVTPRGLDSSGKLWEVYDPAIRDSAYYNRLQHLYEELEKQVGVSRGVLTEPASYGATATEIKAANYDTYSIIADMRTGIEEGLERLAYAVDVLANVYGMGAMGDYAVSFDWSYNLIESSQESFNQLISATSVGAADAAEVRQFIFDDETLEEAEKRCDEIAAAKAESSRILLEQAMDREREI